MKPTLLLTVAQAITWIWILSIVKTLRTEMRHGGLKSKWKQEDEIDKKLNKIREEVYQETQNIYERLAHLAVSSLYTRQQVEGIAKKVKYKHNIEPNFNKKMRVSTQRSRVAYDKALAKYERNLQVLQELDQRAKILQEQRKQVLSRQRNLKYTLEKHKPITP